MSEVAEKEKAIQTVKELVDLSLDGKLAGKFDGVAKLSDVDAKFAEFTKSLTTKEPEKTEKAEMEQGMVANIAKTEFFGIEFGKIAVGTFGAVFTSELIDGFLAAQSTMVKGVVKLAIAGTVGTWGKRWVGKETAAAIALVIGVFGLSQVLPVDKWARNLAVQLRGILPGTIKVMDSNPNVMAQAQRVAADYYAGLGGRR